ncbi:MAG: glycosyltransferase family 4 protein [Gammaproteobacteria bacterium]
MRGLRLTLVGPLPPPSGGMANQTRQLGELLRSEGVTVEVVQVNAPYAPRWVAGLAGVRALFRLAPYLMRLWRAAGHSQLFHIMANSGWSWHLFAVPAVWIAHLRGVPVVVNYRGGEAATFFSRSFAWIKPTLKRATVMVPSAFLELVFKEYGVAAHIVPNIIDLSRFHADPQAGHSRLRNAPHIVVARNLEPIYDVVTALKAFAAVRHSFPAARLSIAGSGPQREALEKVAEQMQLGDSVRFTGRLENADMAALYRDADIVLNPSLADNMPISILEALASGVPVVSTDVGGVPHLVKHRCTAILVPPQNPEAMAEAVLEVLNDSALAQQMVAAGHDLIQRYTWPEIRPRLFALYSGVMQMGSSR